MEISAKERDLLRRLGAEVAEIAELPVHDETRRLWQRLNGLDQERPMVGIDQIAWHEIHVNDELTVQSEDEFARLLEWKLRQTLYRWRHMRADMVVEKYIAVPMAINDTGFGVEKNEEVSYTDPDNPVVGHRYFDQLATPEDLKKITTPRISLDRETNKEREQTAKDIFEGILDIRMTGLSPMFYLWDRIVEWHGVENSIMDLVDRPEFVHDLMRRYTEAYMGMLDQLEAQGLLAYDIPAVHCSGAYSDELPAPGFDPKRPRAIDTWTAGMAQIFATVSPEMHNEFEIEYAIPWYERFGLGYYGCCEPLHDKIDIIDRLPRVRKISISPWADVKKAAKRMAGRYVMSRKPSPAFLATETWDREAVRKDLQETYDTAKAAGCAVEFILKDISTVKYDPQRLWEWDEIAKSVVGA